MSTLVACAVGGVVYMAIAGGFFWLMASYEHVGRSGLGSALSKSRSEVRSLALLAIAWLPLLTLVILSWIPLPSFSRVFGRTGR